MLNRILAKAMQLHASDVHIHTGVPIQMRIGGDCSRPIRRPSNRQQSESMVLQILTPEERALFVAHNDLDFAYRHPGRSAAFAATSTASDGESMRSFADTA